MSQSSSADAEKPKEGAGGDRQPFSRTDINTSTETPAEDLPARQRRRQHPQAVPTAQDGAKLGPKARARLQAARKAELMQRAQQDKPLRPPAPASRFEMRHLLLTLSFLLIVALPTAVAAWYLWTKAEDQYVSTVGFSVRKEDAAPTLDVLGGLTQITGNSSATDADILYDFLSSEDIVSRIDRQIDLKTLFSREWPNDPVFAYDPSGTIEDLTDHWQRQVKVIYDTSTQLITLRVSAYTPEDALAIAQATFDESSRTINRLSDIARDDATRFARSELARAQDRLTESRQKLTAFRMRTQIVDPSADLAGQMGILNTLQASLATALIDLDTLRENAGNNDQRVIQAEKKIEAIRARINEERSKFGASSEGPGGESYAQLVAEYEKLASDQEFDQIAFQSAQAAYDVAQAEAQRQSRYLAAHIEPQLAQASLAPNRPLLTLGVLGALLLIWSVLLLIYYSVRDRR